MLRNFTYDPACNVMLLSFVMLHTFEDFKVFYFVVEESVIFLLQKSSNTKTESTYPIGHLENNENKDFMETQKISEAVKMVPSDHTTTYNGGIFSSASTSSLSPSRYLELWI